MGGPIDIGQKWSESVIHDHEPDLLVTKVRCIDLPDSDRGDFRCRRAIDLSIVKHLAFNSFSDELWMFSNWCAKHIFCDESHIYWLKRRYHSEDQLSWVIYILVGIIKAFTIMQFLFCVYVFVCFASCLFVFYQISAVSIFVSYSKSCV